MISGTFVLQLALNINDKIEGAGICVVVAFFSRLVFLLPQEMRSQIRLSITFLQRGQADEAGLIFSYDRKVLSAFYLIIQCLQLLQKCFKGLRLLLQNSIDILTKDISVFYSARVVCSFCTLPIWLRSNNGKAVFQANQIADFLQGDTG